MSRIVHSKDYGNKSLCRCLLLPYAYISNDLNKITCPECYRIAKAWEDNRFIVKGLKVIK